MSKIILKCIVASTLSINVVVDAVRMNGVVPHAPVDSAAALAEYSKLLGSRRARDREFTPNRKEKQQIEWYESLDRQFKVYIRSNATKYFEDFGVSVLKVDGDVKPTAKILDALLDGQTPP